MSPLAWLQLARAALAPTILWDWTAGLVLASAAVSWDTALLLPLDNVDTDQLIPARFMSTPRSEGSL